jgi:hypothetical protein
LVLTEYNDGFVQASLLHDWQFATDRRNPTWVVSRTRSCGAMLYQR